MNKEIERLDYAVYCVKEQYNYGLGRFIEGALEALYKTTHVSTSKPHSDNYMHDKGWQLTKTAKSEFEKTCTEWFEKNYKDLRKLVSLGEAWCTLGVWFVCSVQGEGIGYLDTYLGISDDETRRKLKRLGNKLHKAAQSAFKTNEAFLLYRKRGGFCDFQFPLTNN